MPTDSLSPRPPLLLLLLLLAAGTALGVVAPSGLKVLPDVDAASLGAGTAAAVPAAGAELRARFGRDLRFRWDARTGLPSRMIRQTGPLGAPQPGLDAEEAARRFLQANADLFPFGTAGLESLSLHAAHREKRSGIVFLRFGQEVDGIRVFGGELRVAVGVDGAVWAASAARLRPGAPVVRGHADGEASAAAALSAAVEGAPSRLEGVEKVWFLEGTRLLPAWMGTQQMADGSAVYQLVVEDGSGRLLYRRNVVLYASTRGNVFTEQPDAGPREVVPFPDDTDNVVVESPEGWAFSNETVGPNADCKDDIANDNEATPGVRGVAGGAGTPADPFFFDDPWIDDPGADLTANVAGLFYLMNVSHDWFYELGFDESAGNFQADNFGRGGLDGDWVYGDAQDGMGTCNANFIPSPDGEPGRLQMFIWHPLPDCNPAGGSRDASIDGDIVIHEYVHGVSTRLVGGRDRAGCLSGIQSGAMGEGWSDYFPGSWYDDPLLGEYATFGAPLRTQPMDAPTDRYTYGDLCTISQNPVFPCEVHDDGEIWAQALWDMRDTLIALYGGNGGIEVADVLALNGMKFTNCNPTFLDARDGILAADRSMYKGEHYCAIWEAFARGGMGVSASSTDHADDSPVEAFDLPAECVSASAVQLDRPAYLCADDLYVTVTDANGGRSVDVTLLTTSGDTLDVQIDGAPPVYISGPIPLETGVPVDTGDTTLQAAPGDTVGVSYQTDTDQAVVDCTAQVVITRLDILSETCDDDFLPEFPNLTRFLDTDESVVLRVQIASDTPGMDLTGVTAQLTTTHPEITIDPAVRIAIGTLPAPQGESRPEVVVHFALAAGALGSPDSADFSLNLEADGASDVAGDDFTLRLNADYELVSDTMTEDFETGAADWVHGPAGPLDEWILVTCNANSGIASYHNGGGAADPNCADYSDDQDNPYLGSKPFPLPPEAVAFRLQRIEFQHDVDLGTGDLGGFPVDVDAVILNLQNEPITVDLSDPFTLAAESLAFYANIPAFGIDSNTNGAFVRQELFPDPDRSEELDPLVPIRLVWAFLPDVTDVFQPCPVPALCDTQGGGYYVDDLAADYDYAQTVPQGQLCASGSCSIALNVDERYIGPLCPGDQVDLSAEESGAVNCPSGIDFEWLDDQLNQIGTGPTFSFNPASTTQISVRGTCLDDPLCDDARPFKVIVPCDIVGDSGATTIPDPVCQGTVVTLDGAASFFSDCPGGPMEYRWSGPGVSDTWTSDPTAPATIPGAASADYTLEVRRQGDAACFDTDVVTATIDTGDPAGSIANELRVSLPPARTEIVLDWSSGGLTPDRYSVHRSDDPAALVLPDVLPATEEASLDGQGETYNSPWAAGSLLFYRVFGLNTCTGEFVDP